MKTKEIKNETPEIFYFNEGKYIRAIGEAKGYCTSANKILAILKENELTVNASIANKALLAPLNELEDIIMIEQKNRLSNLSDTAREQLLVKPNLNAIELIRSSMVQTAAYNAGFIPSEYMKFNKGKFVADEKSLKEFFTIYRNEQTDKIENLVNDFLGSWEKLKTYSKELNFDNVINVYGIIHFDPYSETFSFNKLSSDLTILKTTKNNKNGTA